MTKTLIAGIATIAVAGAALVATGMYASTESTTTNSTSQSHQETRMNQKWPEDLIATLSGKVSTEALTALQTLMTKHKTEMDAARSNSGTTADKTAIEAQHTAFKAEMDALLTKYPELKAAMPVMGKGGNGGPNNEIKAIMETLPTSVQEEINTIRETYKAKREALKTEEDTKINTVLSAYPDIQTKLKTLNESRPGNSEGKGRHGGPDMEKWNTK